MLSLRSAACSRLRRLRRWCNGWGMRRLRVRRCVRWRVRRRSRCRMRSGGCGSWTVWKVRARPTRSRWRCGCGGRWTGVRCRRRWAPWLGGTRACARSSPTRSGFRGSRSWMRMPRGLGLRERRGAKPRLPERFLRGRVRALILRASLRCVCMCLRWGRASTLFFCCCITLPATAGRWHLWCAISGAFTRRAAVGKRQRWRRCRFNMPITRCGSMRFWARRMMVRARYRASCRSGPASFLGYRIRSIFRSTVRVLRYRAIAGGALVCGCLGRCMRVCCGLRGPLHAGLLELARASGASLFMVLQAGLSALLTRLGAGDDITIGSPIAGRNDSALDDLVGFFVNTLVLRTDTSGAPSFRELVGRVRAGNLAAYSHQELPFERLVEVLNPARSLSRHPLFQVMLVLQNNAELGLELSGLSAGFEAVATASAKFDLSLSLVERRGSDGSPAGIEGALEYASDLFDRSSV